MDAETVGAFAGTLASLRAIRDAQAMPLKIQLDSIAVRLDVVLRALQDEERCKREAEAAQPAFGVFYSSPEMRADGRMLLTAPHAVGR